MKKFATLLPNNWLANTPQPLAVRWPGRQSAGSGFLKSIGTFLKTAGKLAFLRVYLQS
ncbi:hypothetical protein ACQKOM_13035 [Peribacillus frigoritolerans]|uniref:hypothetical protein n=1 Tax=Peribacillus frigoritolerans TaxID=450367 RepID=UPI003D02DCC4